MMEDFKYRKFISRRSILGIVCSCATVIIYGNGFYKQGRIDANNDMRDQMKLMQDRMSQFTPEDEEPK